MPNTTTMITVSNLYKMHLIPGDDENWVRARIAPLPSIVGKGSTILTLVEVPCNMTIA